MKSESGKPVKKKKKKRRVLLVILLFFLLLFVVLSVLSYFEYIYLPVFSNYFERQRILQDVSNMDDESYEVEHIDALEYFEEKSDLKEIIKVEESSKVINESDALSEFKIRGFESSESFTEYSMDGEYLDITTISSNSSKKHPMYTAIYTSKNGEIWTICIVNDSIIAIPVSFNMQSGLPMRLIISESETITVYDNYTNSFYVNIPHSNEKLIKVVERIDSSLLDSLTIDVLGDEYE